ncbi:MULTISPECIES: alpha/beta fold hydrolase [unclassified Streptomyces]|uniref:alpha/beta hydrolase n=1 Tax=Streptomyces TaxID=1883 RepID=UPI00136ABBBE|nr:MULTISPECIES: alpha/beta fold hydrolase [unclassified Streptomyces]NDZ97731.1 alpha/beta hydrolase [Streptomyces sp. SID10116]MYY87151.1 alpha/beta fold hydrolase [Streptomyces sp. SID335]MYZ15910.1 alpha/beta fold hydrolase [Streptomyces sp. SID337]NDZ90912.1 alpha/beta hydrolase [Streptomyces sp. SID10115]NEB46586.1 alpha/beta hydrolase [Streptomyces sp. SID339]
MATYVLVHGSHGSGAFWAPVARELALRGHRVVAVDQPWHGTEAHLPAAYQTQDVHALATEPSPLAGIGMDDFERRVTGAVRRAAQAAPNGRVVLVGHSMGGCSVSRVANAVPELLAHLVYMTACCFSPGMPSINAVMAVPEAATAIVPTGQVVGDPRELGVLRLNFRSRDPEDLAVFKEMFCADHADADFLRVLAGLQPDETIDVNDDHAVGESATWGRIPRTYLRFGADRLLPPALQDLMIRLADERTPDNPFQVRDFPTAPHMGPRDPEPIVTALTGVDARP